MELRELTPDAIDYIYGNINTGRLNAWERNFVEDTGDQWLRSRHLTDNQKLCLGKIWDRHS